MCGSHDVQLDGGSAQGVQGDEEHGCGLADEPPDTDGGVTVPDQLDEDKYWVEEDQFLDAEDNSYDLEDWFDDIADKFTDVASDDDDAKSYIDDKEGWPLDDYKFCDGVSHDDDAGHLW